MRRRIKLRGGNIMQGGIILLRKGGKYTKGGGDKTEGDY